MKPKGGSRSAVTEYLERLQDLLPAREAGRVVPEVEGLIRDRMEAEQEAGSDDAEAERRALRALGPPERLAESLVDQTVRVDLATRRAFVRLVAVVFAAHLLLSIVLTVAGAGAPAVPGLLAPLPLAPLGALFSAVLAIFLLDLGALFLLFVVLGRGRAPRLLPHLRLHTPVQRRDSIQTLVLLALIALILHPFRDDIFMVRAAERTWPIMGSDLLALLPMVDVVLALFALRHLVGLVLRREHALGVLADALGSLLLAAFLAMAAARGDLVRFPPEALGAAAAALQDLVTRVLLLVFLVAALVITARFVKRLLRLRDLVARPLRTPTAPGV